MARSKDRQGTDRPAVGAVGPAELLDDPGDGRVAVRSGRPKTALVAGLVLVGVLGWSLRPDDATTNATSQRTTPTSERSAAPARPALGGFAADRTLDVLDLWPSPPDDHEPIVSGRPGPGRPIIDSPSAVTAIVYVNSLGRPTVVDLATGNTREVELAATRSEGSFLVDDATIVHDDPKRGLGLPSSDAVTFAFRLVSSEDRPETGQPRVPPLPPSVSLCPTVDACSDTAWRPTSFRNGAALIELLDPLRHPAAAALLDGSTWQPRDRWLVPPDSLDLGSFRLPRQADNTDTWVITSRP